MNQPINGPRIINALTALLTRLQGRRMESCMWPFNRKKKRQEREQAMKSVYRTSPAFTQPPPEKPYSITDDLLSPINPIGPFGPLVDAAGIWGTHTHHHSDSCGHAPAAEPTHHSTPDPSPSHDSGSSYDGGSSYDSGGSSDCGGGSDGGCGGGD